MAARLEPVAPADAIAVLQARGRQLDRSFHWQERYADDHARAFTVAKSVGFDILADIHRGLEAALKEGKTARQFSQELTPLLQAKGWWGRKPVTDPAIGLPVSAQLGSPRRLQLIFDVNMRVSYAAGHWASFERNKAVRPFLRYVHLEGQEHPRRHHQAWHNVCLPVDHPWWKTHAAPNGWNCHCTIQSLSGRDIDRLLREGVPLRFEPPTVNTVPWTNKVTGEVRLIPEGIDPGWDHNAGQDGYRAALSNSDRLMTAPPALAARVYDDTDWLVRPLAEGFGEWFDQARAGGTLERSMVMVGALSDPVLAALAARGVKITSGALTLEQAAVRQMLRPDLVEASGALPAEALRRLPELLAAPRAILMDRRDGNLIYVFDLAEDEAGKLIIGVDYGKVRADDVGRQTGIMNAIRTAGVAKTADLADAGAYEIIAGVL